VLPISLLDDGTSLSVSNFDVAGETYKRVEGIYLWGKRCLAPETCICLL
jgi:hypothetical protein